MTALAPFPARGAPSGRAPQPDRRPTTRRLLAALSSPLALSRIVLSIGVMTVVSAASPAIRGRVSLLTDFLPGVFPAAATTGALVVGTLMVVVSRGVRRAKFRAWLLCTVLAASSIVLDLLKGLDFEEATAAAVLLCVLLRSRESFTARPDPRSTRRVLQVAAAGPLIATALGTLWLSCDVDGQVPGTTWTQRISSAATGLVGIQGPAQFVSSTARTSAAVGLAVLGAGVLAALVLALLRPADGPRPLSDTDDVAVRDLIGLWGDQDSLSYFATRADRSLKLSPNGQAAVTYRVLGAVSLAGGDPLGNPDCWPDAIAAWLAECDDYGWTPAVLGASESGATAYGRFGLDALEIGDEAILDVAAFTLAGREMRTVRQAVARCERAGITARCVRVGDLTPPDLARVTERADAWRDGTTERGFSMALGRFVDDADPDSVLVLAHDQGGQLHGLLSLVPWGSEGVSLDLMRRDRDSANGIIELLVATLCEAAPGLGITRVSLNFAVFRAVFARGDRIGAGPVLRLWCGVLRLLSRYWQIESLYRSNEKFRPAWVPRFVCFRRATDLPRIGTTVMRAEAFLVVPPWMPGVR